MIGIVFLSFLWFVCETPQTLYRPAMIHNYFNTVPHVCADNFIVPVRKLLFSQ